MGDSVIFLQSITVIQGPKWRICKHRAPNPEFSLTSGGKKNPSHLTTQSSPVNNIYPGDFPSSCGKQLHVSYDHLFSHCFWCVLLKSKSFPHLIVSVNYLWKSNYLQVIQLFGKVFLIGIDGERISAMDVVFRKIFPDIVPDVSH